MTDNAPADDFLPTAGWPALRLRAALLKQARAFFDARGFLEVETPILSADTVVDRHLDPFTTRRAGLPSSSDALQNPQTFYLQTSPEFGMKRLMAAGGEAIYQITRAFRQDELGPRHNPEFTMLEWYRRGDDLDAGMQLLSDLSEQLLARGPAERLSYEQAFVKYAGVHPHQATSAELALAVEKANVIAPESLPLDDREGWLDLLLVELVEPRLGVTAPTILYDYPASQAALAVVRDTGAFPVAERFELYVQGIELANGYHELLDPAALMARNQQNNLLRQADGKDVLPEESRLLAAMRRGLPACAGVALGFDRLVMLAAGASDIQQVLAFPMDRA